MKTDYQIRKMQAQITMGRFTILNMRTIARIVELCNGYWSDIRIVCNGITANCKSIMDIALLNIPLGATITVIAEGIDAFCAIRSIRSFFRHFMETEKRFA